MQASDIPREPSKATKVRTLGRQRFLFLLGYSWSGRWTQCCAPGEKAFHFHDSFLSHLNIVTISVRCVFIPSDVTFKQTKLRLYTKGQYFQEKKHVLMNLMTWWKWMWSFVVQLTKALILPNSLLSPVHE